MAGFSWMSGTLALLLFAGNCVAAVDQNHLAELVNEIWEKYKGRQMFSMAASIPEKKNMDQRYDTNQVFNNENANKLKMEIKNGIVYKEGRIVAATFLKKKGKNGKDVHAEYRVLQNFDTLLSNNYDKDHDLLLFYVLGSPCYHQCTNESDPQNILQYLYQIKRWKHYAFVFTYIFKSKNPNKSTDEDQLREALENLGIKSGLGLKNIFRCVKSDDHMQCTSCSSNNQVAQYCVSDPEKESDSNQRQPSTSATAPGNNANKKATTSSLQGSLDSGNGSDMGTGENGNRYGGRRSKGRQSGKGLSRRKRARRRQGKGRRGRKRGGKGLNRRKGGRRRGGKGRGGRKRGGKGLNRRKGGRRRGGKSRGGGKRGGKGLNRRKGGRRRGGKGRGGGKRGGKGLNRRKGGRRRGGKSRGGGKRGGKGLNRRKGGRRRGGKSRGGGKRGGKGLNRRKGGRRRGGKGRGGGKRGGKGLNRRKGGRRRGGKGRGLSRRRRFNRGRG